LLYRIDFERYLTHAIDHFTKDELSHFEYAIISAGVNNRGLLDNVVKISALFPTTDIMTNFADYGNKEILKKMYFNFLDDVESRKIIYKVFINTFLHHQDILIICREKENAVIDVLVEYLKKNYSLECIDLNELFSTGKAGSIYIDRDKIHNKTVDIRREATKDRFKSLESTSDGRLDLLNKMSVKTKIKKLKSLGINVTKSDLKDLDKLLIELWVEGD
jgi:hypothetical protein